MADFPPAQYIDGYSATGNTISFTIAGYTKKKVASLTLTDGGSYSTPSASVAISGGSGSGASATASMGIKSISFAPVGSADLLNTTTPESVDVTIEGNAEVEPIFGLTSALINTNLYYDITTTPSIAVTGENGAYTDAVATLNSTSTLSVTSLNLPVSSTPVLLAGSQALSMKIVQPNATGTVLGMANMTTDGDGSIDGVDVVSWATATSKSTLQGLSLALYYDPASKYTITGITANVALFFDPNETPSVTILNIGNTISGASIDFDVNNIVGLNPNPNGIFNYDGGGLYLTNSFTVNPTHVYTNAGLTLPATNASFTVTSSLYTILTSATAIGSVKIATEASPSRISVGTIGTGYTSIIKITPTGLYANPELANLASFSDFTVKNRLNGASVSDAGSGYITAPTVTLTGGGITNSDVTKTLVYKVVSSTVIGGLDFVTAPTATFSGTLSSGGTNATATAVLSTNPAISLPNLTGAEADPTTGDCREICHALCELADTINTNSVNSSLQTTLQTGGSGVIDKFTFVFDLVPESGALAVESEP